MIFKQANKDSIALFSFNDKHHLNIITDDDLSDIKPGWTLVTLSHRYLNTRLLLRLDLIVYKLY